MEEIPKSELERAAQGAPVVPEDMQAVRGDAGSPVVILVHGHATTKLSWTDPYKESLADGTVTFDLALADTGSRPTRPFLPNVHLPGLSFSTPLRLLNSKPKSMWRFLGEEGLSLITWSQAEPNGSYKAALAELQVIVRVVRSVLPDRSIVLVGHSRGGLVARKYVQESRNDAPELRKVILLACPNAGSALARYVNVLGKATGILSKIAGWIYRRVAADIGLSQRDFVDQLGACFGGLLPFVTGAAIEELTPGSEMLESLAKGQDAEKRSNITYVNVSGYSNLYTKLYLALDGQERFKEVTSFFNDLPDFLVPDELDDGEGDGLVSLRRSRLDWAAVQRSFPVNHASVLIDEAVKELVKNQCKTLD